MAPTDYIVMTSTDRLRLAGASAWLAPRASAAGWRCAVSHPFLRVYVGSKSRLDVIPAFDGHGVFLGEAFDRDSFRRLHPEELQSLASRRLDGASAQGLIERIWGRYVVVRRSSEGASALRDPSGALECVGWTRGPLQVFASTAQAPADLLFPDETTVLIDRVADMTATPGEYSHALGLSHLHPTPAGSLLTLGAGRASVVEVWRPADIYRLRARRPSDDDVRDQVVQAVRATAGERRLIAELSGGLDSAIVAAALTDAQRRAVVEWVNHYTAETEGDERRYARAVAGRFGLELTEVLRDGLPVDLAALATTAAAFRPAINDLDPGYNADIEARIARTDVDGVLTGQGGDGVFFQMATPLIGLDEIGERGWRTRPPVLFRIARWTRQSAWPWTWTKALVRHRWDRRRWDHPWVADLSGVPPAKAFQINALAYCQVFQQTARRSRQGECLNPLLAQPVMELGLSLSIVDLTWGGRDRALARRAFAADLPPFLIERRSKGDVGAFYGQAMARRLDVLRPYLLDGALAEAGCIDRDALSALLSAERLLWQGGHGEILSLALIEAWLRHWRSRLASRPRLPSDIGQTSRSPERTSA